MHYSVFVLIPGGADPESAVELALAPFDEALDVAPYRVWFTHSEVNRMAEYFRISPADLQSLVEKMPQWTNHPGGVDQIGLYALSTFNPDGRWDWYEIGGRWNGTLPGATENVVSAAALAGSKKLQDCLPYCVLTPEGNWLESQRFYRTETLGKVREETMKQQDWLKRVRRTLKRWPDHDVVCVDLHC